MDTYENNREEQTEQMESLDALTGETTQQEAFEELQETPAQEAASAPEEETAAAPEVILYPQPAQEEKPASKKRSIWKPLLCGVLVVALVIGSCAAVGIYLNEAWADRLEDLQEHYEDKIEDLEDKINRQPTQSGNTGTGYPVVSFDGMTPSQIYAANVNAVVLITAEVSESVFGQTTTGVSTGSGFVISDNGYVVTNCHVVEGSSKLTVQTGNGQSYDAKLIGADSANDVAVLKVDAEGLQYVNIGSSSDLIVGDQVVAIGNPLGELTSTLTVGYVSAKERDVNTDGTVINMIQTDAAINSGNSGGPLFNTKGEVVGITTAKYSGTSNSGASIEGIGFAIPIDDVYDMIEDLVQYGYITGAYLGISVSDTDPDATSYFDYPLGAYVHEVVPGYCAEKAGLRAKDIIVELDGKEVGGLNDLSRVLRGLEPGETTTIEVFRTGQDLALEITLDEEPQEAAEDPVPQQTYPQENMPSNGDFDEWFDFFFGN